MTDKFLDYLYREHARLEDEIRKERKRLQSDEMQIARLKKLTLALKDQIDAWMRDNGTSGRLTA